jgi:hypothetical protein
VGGTWLVEQPGEALGITRISEVERGVGGAETHKRTEYGGHRKEGIKTTNSLENIAYVRH